MSTGASFKFGDRVGIDWYGKKGNAIYVGQSYLGDAQVLIEGRGHGGWAGNNHVLAKQLSPGLFRISCWNVRVDPKHIWLRVKRKVM